MDERVWTVTKFVGWQILGDLVGIPVSEICRDLVRPAQQSIASVNQVLEENQKLRDHANLLLRASAELGVQVSQLQEENLKLRAELSQLNLQKSSRLPGLPKTGTGNPLVMPTFKWLGIMPECARCLILGGPGSGKSTQGHMLLELHRWKAFPYVFGFPQGKEHLLPSWIGLADSFDKIPMGSIILIDEAYLRYHARGGSFNKSIQDLSEELGLARQRGHSPLFVAHESRYLDKNIVSYANLFIFKDPGAMDLRFERPELRDVLGRAKDFFQTAIGDKRGWSYVWSPDVGFEGPLRTMLPSYWGDELSRAYAQGVSSSAQRDPSISKDEKKAQAKSLREAGLSYSKIAKVLDVGKSTVIDWVKHDR